VLPRECGSKGAMNPLDYIKLPYSQPLRRNFFENLKKTQKGIDKIRIRFIIELWGKVGKKGER
jgi:hypothetical protein